MGKQWARQLVGILFLQCACSINFKKASRGVLFGGGGGGGGGRAL